MNNEIATINTDLITKEKIQEYLTAFNMTSLTPTEQLQFIEIALAYQLNPFKREIYCVPYMKNVKNEQTGQWVKERALSIITGYEVYLKRAERTGKLDGWKCEIKDRETAMATIYRKDWKNPFVHEVYLSEVGQFDKEGKPMSMWKKMPKFMLKKVCMAQAFRLAFPDEFGGMPYTADELPDNMTVEIKPEIKSITEKVEEEFCKEPSAADQAKAKLDALPDTIKNGFKALGYNAKLVWEICTEAKWNNDEIKKVIDADANGSPFKNNDKNLPEGFNK
jgi:phage recombination protein Bet